MVKGVDRPELVGVSCKCCCFEGVEAMSASFSLSSAAVRERFNDDDGELEAEADMMASSCKQK